ncbi:hypothetical protein GCM10027294_21500 [Marinactinospora endophytica]
MAKDSLPPEGNQIDPVTEAARESGRRVADLFRALWELLRALFGRNSSRSGGAEPRQSGRGPMGERAAARPRGGMGPPARPRIGYWRGLAAAVRGVVVAVRGVVSAAGELRRAFRARREERRRAGSSEAPGRAGRSGRSSGRPSRSPGSTPAWQRPLIAAAAVAGRVWRASARAFAATRNLFRRGSTAESGPSPAEKTGRSGGEEDPRQGPKVPPTFETPDNSHKALETPNTLTPDNSTPRTPETPNGRSSSTKEVPHFDRKALEKARRNISERTGRGSDQRRVLRQGPGRSTGRGPS